MAAKRPTNNNVAMKLTDSEVDALMEVADSHGEKTTTQAKSCFLFGLEMSPVIEMVRGMLEEEGRFGTAVRVIEPEISDDEVLRWIQNTLIECVYREREALSVKTMRLSNILKGKTPPANMNIPTLDRFLKKRGEDAAMKVIDDAVSSAIAANGWSFEESDNPDWY